MAQPTDALRSIVNQIVSSPDYQCARVAWVEGGHEAWIVYEDTFMKVNSDGEISVTVMSWDWIPVPKVTVPVPAPHKALPLPTRYRGKASPDEIATVRNWAKAMGKELPREGLESVTQELVDEYFNWLEERHPSPSNTLGHSLPGEV